MLDSELVISSGGKLNFDALLQRIHPAASRIAKLSQEAPARIVVFDLLGDGKEVFSPQPLSKRRVALEKFFNVNVKKNNRTFTLSPRVLQYKDTARWLTEAGRAVDGLIAKDLTLPYLTGKRGGMQKIKFKKTADCVIAGYRTGKGKLIGSFLLGLYDTASKLNHVGYFSSLVPAERQRLTKMLSGSKATESFTGKAPGGVSRWATETSAQWQPVKPTTVVEVEYDHFTGDRFSHATKYLRLRVDKKPKQCVASQVSSENSSLLLDHL